VKIPSRRLFWWLTGTLIGFLVLITGLGWAGFLYLQPYYWKAESYDLKKMDEHHVTTVFQDRHGEEVGRLFIEDRTLLDHDEIPDRMRQAVLAVEDKRFYSHHGIDYRGVLRAMATNLKTGRRSQGASTITQQLAKNLIGRFEKTLERKLTEAFLALRIERYKTKDEILDYYLNRIYFGKGSYGLAAASQEYFGKPAKDLTLAESALLAGLIKSPNTSSPRNDARVAIKNRDQVIRLMATQNRLKSGEAAEALNEPLKLAPEANLRLQSYFMAYAMKDLRDVLKVEEGGEIPQGLLVKTTMDAVMQRDAEKQVAAQLEEISKNQEAEGSAGNRVEAEARLQAAALVMEMKSGAVRVLMGGRNFDASPFDRARMARRENGALLQPFLYALAFERLGLHPASMIDASFLVGSGDLEEVGFGDPDKDLGRRFLMIQDALAVSNKASATRVGLGLGMGPFTDWLVSAGVGKAQTGPVDLTWNLKPLTLQEMTSLYQTLGNEGMKMKPYVIESVMSDQGEILYQAPAPAGKALLDPLVAKQMTLTLQSVTRDGTASSLSHDYNLPVPVAGMTGYSEGYRDAWFVGYTPTLAAGVWMGYDSSTSIGTKRLASQTALPAWGRIMQQVLKDEPQGIDFPVPGSLSKIEVDRRSGLIKGLGFMSPGAGNVFVYLRQDQINRARQGSAASQIQQPKDWSDWLSTMYADPGADTPVGQEESSTGEIPLVAEYRMPALRGDILTADGKILATMAESHALVLRWPSLDVVGNDDAAVAWARKTLLAAKEWLGKESDLTDADLRLLYRFRRFHPILVAEKLEPGQVTAFPSGPLPGLGFFLQGVPLRVYPEGELLAHTLGYLQRIQGTNRKRYQAGEVVYDEFQGSAGLEALFDRELRGQDGKLTLATTLEGFVRAAAIDAEATAGARVRTTIDYRVQKAAEHALGGIRAGAVVVLDVRNGDILAMASRPTFDPNAFLPRLSPEMWKSYVEAEKNPLWDRSYRQQNPPGSTFKVVTALASVRAGVFDPQRQVNCPGYFAVGNMRYELPREVGSPVSFRRSMAYSFNTYFFDLGQRTGRDFLIEMSKELGLGQPTGIVLPGELAGLIPTPDFVRVTHKRSMGAGDVANMSIGQGDVLTTPLQMANAMGALANGGILHRPRLVRQLEDAKGAATRTFPPETLRTIPFPKAEIKTITEGMVAVTEEGTGKAAGVPGIRVASKSGTAQVGSKAQPRQIAWLVGFLPAEAPLYAFSVMIEGDLDQDLHGGQDAGVVAGNVFREVYSTAATAELSGRN
jgi:penicillin-binding protein 2